MARLKRTWETDRKLNRCTELTNSKDASWCNFIYNIIIPVRTTV